MTANEATDQVNGPWQAGAVGRIPQDDPLVWRDDAVDGPQFYAATPGDAEIAASQLNALEARIAELERALSDAREVAMSTRPEPTGGKTMSVSTDDTVVACAHDERCGLAMPGKNPYSRCIACGATADEVVWLALAAVRAPATETTPPIVLDALLRRPNE